MGGGAVGRWREGDDLVAHFWRRVTFEQASGKLGGGMRGRYRVRGTQELGPQSDPGDRAHPGVAAAEAAAAAAALSGGRTGPRVPGAFGRPAGKGAAAGGAEVAAASALLDWDDI